MLNFSRLLDEAVTKRAVAKTASRSANHFHISDAGLCYRKRYYKRLGIPSTREIPAGALRKMLAGEGAHQILQEVLKDYGILWVQELPVDMPGVLGHFDGITKDGLNKTLLEFKTVEKWSMGHIKKDGPKPEHLIQMFTYWALLRKDFTYLTQASLIYLMREDFQSVTYDYLWDRDVAVRVAREWRPLLRYWAEQILPPCTCNKDYGGSGVNYCNYQNAATKETCCDESLFTNFTKGHTND